MDFVLAIEKKGSFCSERDDEGSRDRLEGFLGTGDGLGVRKEHRFFLVAEKQVDAGTDDLGHWLLEVFDHARIGKGQGGFDAIGFREAFGGFHRFAARISRNQITFYIEVLGLLEGDFADFVR